MPGLVGGAVAIRNRSVVAVWPSPSWLSSWAACTVMGVVAQLRSSPTTRPTRWPGGAVAIGVEAGSSECPSTGANGPSWAWSASWSLQTLVGCRPYQVTAPVSSATASTAAGHPRAGPQQQRGRKHCGRLQCDGDQVGAADRLRLADLWTDGQADGAG